MADGIILCSAAVSLVFVLAVHMVVAVVAVELGLQALDGTPQRFWHDDQPQCTSPTSTPVYVEEEEDEENEGKSRSRTKVAKSASTSSNRVQARVSMWVNKRPPSASQASIRP